jgi:hypothetical protein
MYLVAIAWIYVVLMMAVAEAMSTQGTVLGAIITFVLYGVLPLAIVLYVLGSPMRRKARLAAEQATDEAARQAEGTAAADAGASTANTQAAEAAQASAAAASALAPDGSRQAPGGQATGLLAAERKEV